MKVDNPNSANARMISLQQSQPNAENLIKVFNGLKIRNTWFIVLLNLKKKDLQLINFQGGRPERRVYKLVLTGGPCGGKTTGQSKLATFFESLGWKVNKKSISSK